jgi:predicted nucleic acid-binding protein
MYLLDTNVVSELRVRARTHPRVALWADGRSADEMYLSAVTILEIEIGALRLARRDPAAGKVFQSWIDAGVLPAFEGRILAFDIAIARRCAALHVPDPRSERDAMIAATALVHGLTVVTRNLADFEPTGVTCLNPWR